MIRNVAAHGVMSSWRTATNAESVKNCRTQWNCPEDLNHEWTRINTNERNCGEIEFEISDLRGRNLSGSFPNCIWESGASEIAALLGDSFLAMTGGAGGFPDVREIAASHGDSFLAMTEGRWFGSSIRGQ
jgi:hypothetical protein